MCVREQIGYTTDSHQVIRSLLTIDRTYIQQRIMVHHINLIRFLKTRYYIITVRMYHCVVIIFCHI